ISRTSTRARNVVGLVKGRNRQRRADTVIIGAHYDHVGRGEQGSMAGPAGRNQIHNGADDNASGVSAVLELAQAFRQSRLKPKRSLLFILFTGEEWNNVGSRYYVEHPVVPLEQTVAMLNLDMVGRGETGVFMVYGVGTSPAFPELLKRIEAQIEKRGRRELTVHYGPADPGMGDNTPFYRRGVPALLFHTGGHDQYHRPEDDWQLINASNLELITRMAFSLAVELAINTKARPAFAASEQRPQQPPLLGIEADQQRGDGSGVRVAYVAQGSAAELAELRVGDLLIEVDGRRTPCMQVLVDYLTQAKAGAEVELKIERGRRVLWVSVTLGSQR
ncbi:M20/M25/M40 family metallo-hydrolase, partial [Planctomycetota bacterium]